MLHLSLYAHGVKVTVSYLHSYVFMFYIVLSFLYGAAALRAYKALRLCLYVLILTPRPGFLYGQKKRSI